MFLDWFSGDTQTNEDENNRLSRIVLNPELLTTQVFDIITQNGLNFSSENSSDIFTLTSEK